MRTGCGGRLRPGRFGRLIGGKLGIEGSGWGKAYSQFIRWGNRKSSYALDKVLGPWPGGHMGFPGNQQPADTNTQEPGSNRYAGLNQARVWILIGGHGEVQVDSTFPGRLIPKADLFEVESLVPPLCKAHEPWGATFLEER